MNLKKVFKILLIMIVIFSVKENVYAENFTCAVFGNDVEMDVQLARIVKYVILFIQIIVPVILVILGMIDFLKAIAAQKEDEIKKGQHIFIKRAITAVLVFLVIAIVKLFISLLASGSSDGIMNCVNCFVKGPNSSSCG